MKTEKKKKLFEEADDDSSSTSSSSSSDSSSSSSSSSEEETKVEFKVNKSYAKQYQQRKQREELHQMRERGEDLDSDDSSSEEEDDDGNLLTPSVNVQFLKTIKALRNKDESIYDPKSQFFEDGDNDKAGEEKKKKSKPKRFKDVLREQILEQMDDEDNDKSKSESKPLNSKLAYDEQQEELRKSFLKESGNADDSDDSDEDEGDDWMVVKKKGVKLDDATEKEVQEHIQDIEKLSKSTKGDKDFADPRGEVEDGNKFLLDYIKNKKWIDKSYDDGDDDDDDDSNDGGRGDGDEDSLDDIDRADDFEAQYNFRFEQAEAEATSGAMLSNQTYARGQTMNTVRRPDTSRVDKRQARKERKAAERRAKEEQLKRLKNAKRQEMEQKLSQVKTVLGASDEKDIDEVALMKMLEGDYDPEKFEKAMSQAYGDDFYEKEDAEWKSDMDVRQALKGDDDGEAVVGQDDVNGGLYDTYDGEEEEGDYGENDGDGEDEGEEWGNDDVDMDLGDDGEEETEIAKKLREKMQEELYKLDYEDIVAGMPTRFKYRKVEANTYGIDTKEILLARDSTLKQFVSLKKMAPYNEMGEFNANSKKRRRFREMLKQDIEEETEAMQSPEGEGDDAMVKDEEAAEVEEPKKKKRRRLKKGKKKDKNAEESEKTVESQSEEVLCGNKDTDKLEKTSKDDDNNDNGDDGENNKEKKKSRRKKKGKKLSASEREEEDTTTATTPVSSKSTKSLEEKTETSDPSSDKKKKKKRKKKKGAIAAIPTSRLSSYGL